MRSPGPIAHYTSHSPNHERAREGGYIPTYSGVRIMENECSYSLTVSQIAAAKKKKVFGDLKEAESNIGYFIH